MTGSPSDPLLNMADFRRAFCVIGIASRLRNAGLDLRTFVQVGIPESELRGHGYDALIDRVLQAKRSAEAMAVNIPSSE